MSRVRTLAVVAIALLSLPVLGAAAPVVIPTATPEHLVEGHTVFTVIEARAAREQNGTTRFAAAVAVLVREYDAERRDVRFPGVLWFNDQYLVNPDAGSEAPSYRYPCGGAVMAVNRGDPDPRLLLANGHFRTPAGEVGAPSSGRTAANASGEAQPAVTPGTPPSADPGTPPSTDPGTPPDVDPTGPGVDPGTPPSATPGSPPSASPGTPPGASGASARFSTEGASAVHRETYVITDPNDHGWVIDRYEAYEHRSVSLAAGLGTQAYPFSVWVVNVLGGHAFLPDDGSSQCGPYRDDALTPVFDTLEPDPGCGRQRKEVLSAGQDDPCEGYAEPSRNGYCYNGVAASEYGGSCAQAPARLYNALLYFKLEHLGVAGAPRDHSAGSTDTNGCSVGTEWTCPADDDDAEGNSHPFHPASHASHATDQQPCQATSPAPQPNPTNHGGSVGATPGTDVNGKFGPLPCDLQHATREIDIYFSAEARPLRPAAAYLASGPDTAGSDAPFHDDDAAYP